MLCGHTLAAQRVRARSCEGWERGSRVSRQRASRRFGLVASGLRLALERRTSQSTVTGRLSQYAEAPRSSAIEGAVCEGSERWGEGLTEGRLGWGTGGWLKRAGLRVAAPLHHVVARTPSNLLAGYGPEPRRLASVGPRGRRFPAPPPQGIALCCFWPPSPEHLEPSPKSPARRAAHPLPWRLSHPSHRARSGGRVRCRRGATEPTFF